MISEAESLQALYLALGATNYALFCAAFVALCLGYVAWSERRPTPHAPQPGEEGTQ